MSRILVFGADNYASGEVVSIFNRGWMLGGHPAVNGGGSTTLKLEEGQSTPSFLEFGSLVMVTHPKLPNWSGVIDPPWNGSIPIQVAVYNAEYLLSLRAPERPAVLTGSLAEIVGQMLDLFNAHDDLFIRLGDVARADPTPRSETLDGRNYWVQLKALLERSGCEMLVRSEKDVNGRLVMLLDIATRIGVDTGFLYFDGRDGNVIFSNPIWDGPIVNRVIGTSDENDELSRMYTDPFFDEKAVQRYRMRSELIQFRDVREQSTLDRYTETYMKYRAFPRLSFLMNILDKGAAFENARLGNSALIQWSNVIQPGGIRGWSGSVRMVALAYTEDSNLLTAKMETL